MIVRKYKAISYCQICGCKKILKHGDSDRDINGKLKLDCDCDFSHFREFTKEEWDEDLYFEYNNLWKDDSGGNYVAWIMKLNDKNIIVNRSYPSNPGLYDIAIVNSNVQSNSYPFGKTPEIFKNHVDNITLDEIKTIIKKQLRKNKLVRILSK